MTATPSITDRPDHFGELRLRRYRLGELPAGEAAAVETHMLDCAACRGKLRSIEEGEAVFRAEISFDKFAAGVSRAHRVPRSTRRHTLGVIAVLAAAAAVVVLAQGGDKHFRNSIKGESVDGQLRIAGPHGQRSLDPNTSDALQPNEQVRLGFRIPEAAHLIAVSIDDHGQITPLYPESGTAIRAEPSHEFKFLPDSLEFTGTGKERIFLFLVPKAFDVDSVKQSVGNGYQRSQHDLARMQDFQLPLPGARSFTWLLAKP
jgi:hypothetical protein